MVHQFGRNSSIGRITTGGTVTNYTGTGISEPAGIAAGPDGALWFTNSINGTIGRITTGGTVTNFTGTGISEPFGIAAGPDGALWFTNEGNDSIGRIQAVASLGGGNAVCDGVFGGSAQNVTVPAGASCTLVSGTVVTGNVQSQGGSLTIDGPSTTVKGNVQVQGGGPFSITAGVMIGGNLQVQQLASSTSIDSVCGATINGDLQWQNNRAPVTIGGPPGCAGNQVGGNVQVQNNTMPSGFGGPAATVEGNTVRGNLQSQHNTPPAVVSGNTVKGNTQTG